MERHVLDGLAVPQPPYRMSRPTAVFAMAENMPQTGQPNPDITQELRAAVQTPESPAEIIARQQQEAAVSEPSEPLPTPSVAPERAQKIPSPMPSEPAPTEFHEEFRETKEWEVDRLAKKALERLNEFKNVNERIHMPEEQKLAQERAAAAQRDLEAARSVPAPGSPGGPISESFRKATEEKESPQPESQEQHPDFSTATTFEDVHAILREKGMVVGSDGRKHQANDLIGIITDIRDLMRNENFRGEAVERPLQDLPRTGGLREKVRELLREEIRARGVPSPEHVPQPEQRQAETAPDTEHSAQEQPSVNREARPRPEAIPDDAELERRYGALAEKNAALVESCTRRAKQYELSIAKLTVRGGWFGDYRIEQLRRKMKQNEAAAAYYGKLQEKWGLKQNHLLYDFADRIDVQLRPHEVRAEDCAELIKDAREMIRRWDAERRKLLDELSHAIAEGRRISEATGLEFPPEVSARAIELRRKLEQKQADIIEHGRYIARMVERKEKAEEAAEQWRGQKRKLLAKRYVRPKENDKQKKEREEKEKTARDILDQSKAREEDASL